MSSTRAELLCKNAALPPAGQRAAARDPKLAVAMAGANTFSPEILEIVYPQLPATVARRLVERAAGWMTTAHRRVILPREKRRSIIHKLFCAQFLTGPAGGWTDEDWELLIASPGLDEDTVAKIMGSPAPLEVQSRVLARAPRESAWTWLAVHVADDISDLGYQKVIARHGEGELSHTETRAAATVAMFRPHLIEAFLDAGDVYDLALAMLPWDDRFGEVLPGSADRRVLYQVICDPTAPVDARERAYQRAHAVDEGESLAASGVAPLSVQPSYPGVRFDELSRDQIDMVLYRSLPSTHHRQLEMMVLAANPNLSAAQADRVLHLYLPFCGPEDWPWWSRLVGTLLGRFPELEGRHRGEARRLRDGFPSSTPGAYRPSNRHRPAPVDRPVPPDRHLTALTSPWEATDVARAVTCRGEQLSELQWQLLFSVIDDFDGTAAELVALAESL